MKGKVKGNGTGMNGKLKKNETDMEGKQKGTGGKIRKVHQTCKKWKKMKRTTHRTRWKQKASRFGETNWSLNPILYNNNNNNNNNNNDMDMCIYIYT